MMTKAIGVNRGEASGSKGKPFFDLGVGLEDVFFFFVNYNSKAFTALLTKYRQVISFPIFQNSSIRGIR